MNNPTKKKRRNSKKRSHKHVTERLTAQSSKPKHRKLAENASFASQNTQITQEKGSDPQNP